MSCFMSREVNFISAERMASFYRTMNNMRKQQVLCDLNVKIGDKSVSVHKIVLVAHSEYFEKMLTCNFKESNEKEITLQEIEPNAIELLIDFMYTLQLKINECNVQDLLIASKFLLFDDVYNECYKFMKANVNIDNCLDYQDFAISNHLTDLQELSHSYILENFTKLKNSSDFLLLSSDQMMELIQNDKLNAPEEKVYESVMLWVKHDINSRSHFLSELIKCIRMPLISVSYFFDYIDNETLLKSNCLDLLFEALRIYTFARTGQQLASTIYNFKNRRLRNELLLISTWDYIHCRGSLEWIATGDEIYPTKKFTWSSSNPSIILNDGRIICLSGSKTDNKSIKIYDGKKNHWEIIGELTLVNFDKQYLLSQVELDECIYMMTVSGHFKCFNIKENKVFDLEGIDPKYYRFNGLVVLDKLIYMVGDWNVLQYSPNTNKWQVISQRGYPKRSRTICSLDGFLYVMGGTVNQTNFKSAMKFNVSTKKWSHIADMNVERSYAGSVGANGLIYVIGGEICDSCEIYDPKYDKWTLSKNKIISNNHFITCVTALNPVANIKPHNILKFY